MPTPLRLHAALAALLLAALVALAPPARAQAGGDKLDAIRDEVKRLDAAGSYEAALKLLRAVVEDSLDPVSRLERSQRIDGLAAKQTDAYKADRAKAAAATKAGRFDEARAALDHVGAYGSSAEVDEAAAERKRLDAEQAKAGAESAARAEEQTKKRASDAVADRKVLEKAIVAWLDARRQVACSKCHGAGKYTCPTCDGTGQVRRSIGSGGMPQMGECPKCASTGMVRCGPDNCNGTGFSRYKVEAVIWSIWPKAFRDELEKGAGSKKNFIDQFIARASKSDAPTSAAVEAAYDLLGDFWLAPNHGHDAVAVTFDDGGVATAVYLMKLHDADQRETTRWRKAADGTWGLEPPDLAAGGAPAAARPTRRARPAPETAPKKSDGDE